MFALKELELNSALFWQVRSMHFSLCLRIGSERKRAVQLKISITKTPKIIPAPQAVTQRQQEAVRDLADLAALSSSRSTCGVQLGEFVDFPPSAGFTLDTITRKRQRKAFPQPFNSSLWAYVCRMDRQLTRLLLLHLQACHCSQEKWFELG